MLKKILLSFLTTLLCALPLLAQAFGFLGDPMNGRLVYERQCALCHGLDGRGRDGMAVDFFQEWHRLTKSDEELIANIRSGMQSPGMVYGSGMMPPQHLTDEEARDVMAYIREAFYH